VILETQQRRSEKFTKKQRARGLEERKEMAKIPLRSRTVSALKFSRTIKCNNIRNYICRYSDISTSSGGKVNKELDGKSGSEKVLLTP